MEKGMNYFYRLIFSTVFLFTLNTGFSQTAQPEQASTRLKDQLQYIEDHTKVYDGWRAIREDIYRKLVGSFTDSLALAGAKIKDLAQLTEKQRLKADSLVYELGLTSKARDEARDTKNTIRVFGIGLNKTVYNTVLWSVIAGLIFILAIGFLAFRRNLSGYLAMKKELGDLRKEFDDYRQSARLAREKMSMDHFNEIKRLKGK